MKKFVIQFVLLVVVIFVALMFYTGRMANIPFLSQPAHLREVTINEVKFKVELADTPDKRRRGLGGRESLATDSGMLFVFERMDKYHFWMKGLKFPLDFIWIKGDKILDILSNVLPPSGEQTDDSLPIYSSKMEIDKVLEVNGGVVERLKIKVGDTIKLTPL